LADAVVKQEKTQARVLALKSEKTTKRHLTVFMENKIKREAPYPSYNRHFKRQRRNHEKRLLN